MPGRSFDASCCQEMDKDEYTEMCFLKLEGDDSEAQERCVPRHRRYLLTPFIWAAGRRQCTPAFPNTDAASEAALYGVFIVVR